MALCVEICNVCSVECHKNLVHHPTSMACAMACLKCAEDCKITNKRQLQMMLQW